MGKNHYCSIYILLLALFFTSNSNAYLGQCDYRLGQLNYAGVDLPDSLAGSKTCVDVTNVGAVGAGIDGIKNTVGGLFGYKSSSGSQKIGEQATASLLCGQQKAISYGLTEFGGDG
ncbi:MAG: hypothetical protein ABL930_03975, partial [Pseudobdellovibrio sp.]